jgi:hypothetical protein
VIKILFAFNFCDQDLPLANRLVGQVQDYHPDAKILGIADGFEGATQFPVWDDRRHLKRLGGKVAEYSHRQFQAMASIEADLYIQLDPDCYLARPIQRWPEVALIAGCKLPRPDYTLLHGCCWVARPELVMQIAESSPFVGSDYSGSEPNGSASENEGFSRGLARALDPIHWGTFRDCWYSKRRNNDRVQPGYAITHPVKQSIRF